MIEKVLNRKNPDSYRDAQVVQNKGSAGVDGMTVNQLHHYATTHRDGLAIRILKGEYLPRPIKGVTIPKGNGKTRLLGIPTEVDRWLQSR